MPDLEAAELMVHGDKAIMGGEPVFQGTRISVHDVAAMPSAAAGANLAPRAGTDRPPCQNPADGLWMPMVVVHRAHGFRFVIYTSDHAPAHVHITGGGQAKVNLGGPDGAVELVYSVGIKRADMRRLMAEVYDRREELLLAWERIHGPTD